jgi:hypothetical protein
VKAPLDSEKTVWLTSRWPDGSRMITELSDVAAVFSTSDAAWRAIDELSDTYKFMSLRFKVEPED